MSLWDQIKNLLARASEHDTPPERFTKLETRGKVLSSWGGVLKITPFVRHFLRIDNTNYDEFYQNEFPTNSDLHHSRPQLTAEIFIGFQYLKFPHKVQFLHTSQNDFRIPGLSSKFVAAEVGNRLAQKMMLLPYPSKLLGNDKKYWDEEVYLTHQNILYKALKDMNISQSAFDLEPEMYKRRLNKL